ncbi:Protein mak11 [Fusarium poae]|jgi:protein MAK11|uniref:Uncharacterized protein n=1 Tax=Fusarium poae TaxID=36050 RepID=A0A1B8AKM2_FUSPO|nr:hypothetical protein FPOAC1_008008 [Fusarium poae]KAG8668625.1 hypothetical protein FPOAC1_008008 [Fusarium poae]OBS20864.1 hypothetical protein FPOA_07204 [Fusarium poae]
MAKRKRQAVAQKGSASEPSVITKKVKGAQVLKEKPVKEKASVPAKKTATTKTASNAPETIQIVVGSYDRILHGLVVTVGGKEKAEFADSFLFNAHTSAIRCVAVSPISAPVPGQTQKVMLASGATDERVNVYNLSAHPPSRKNQELMAKVAPRPILENSKNREVGTLLHHSSTVTSLCFPTRSKLLSSSEDSTIAVTRTRDWSLLSNIKAPIAKPMGRPSGDTAPFGGTPSGVNDFAIHPSMKLMITVSKGERSMRLWNLVTGKKAGVLNFGKEILMEASEGKHSTGEGRRVVWGSVGGADEFAVGFDRDIIVFGMDSVPKCRIMGSIRTKVHQFFYVALDKEGDTTLMGVATEDGRILFFSTKESDLTKPDSEDKKLPTAKFVGQLGGKSDGIQGRIKDFVVVPSAEDASTLYVAGGSSDGRVRVWRVGVSELQGNSKDEVEAKGELLGTYETQNRITCMTGFMMIPRPDGVEDSDDELDDEDEDEGSDSEED